MKQCRISIVYQESLEGCTASFKSPGLITCVALLHSDTQSGGSPWELAKSGTLRFAKREIAFDYKANPEKFIQAAQSAFEELAKNLRSTYGSDIQILTVLTRSQILRNAKFGGKSAIVIPQDSSSPDLTTSEAFTKILGAKISELMMSQRPETLLTALEFSDCNIPELTPIRREFSRRKKILLHICCGPDAAGVINQLKRDYDVVCFWYDPNIQPRKEYDLRLDAFLKVARIENVPVIVGEYDVENFYDRIQGLEHTPEQGAKCSKCYDQRLERSALEAKKQSCDLYTTTLAISPHKVQEKLKAFGELNYQKYQIPYLAKNFMKDDGFKKSVEYTRDYNIYRQDYCGCYFSMLEGGAQAQQSAVELGITAANTCGSTNPFRKQDQEHPYLGYLKDFKLNQKQEPSSKGVHT